MQSRSPGRVVPAVLASRSTNTCYNTAYTNTNTQRQKYKYKYTNTKAKGRSVTQCLNNICSTSVNTSIFCYKFTLHFNIQIFCDCKFSTYNYNTMSTIIFQDHTIEDHTLQDHSIRKQHCSIAFSAHHFSPTHSSTRATLHHDRIISTICKTLNFSFELVLICPK